MASITVSALADEVNLKPVTVRLYLKEMGIITHRLRDPLRGNQACAAVTQEQADQFRKHREAEGYTGKPIFSWGKSA